MTRNGKNPDPNVSNFEPKSKLQIGLDSTRNLIIKLKPSIISKVTYPHSEHNLDHYLDQYM